MKSHIKFHSEPDLRSPVMITGWPGMGQVALGLVGYLKEKLEAQEFAEIDPEGFFDLGGVIIEDSLALVPAFPESKFYFWRGKDSDLVIFIGEAQPSSNSYDYAQLVMKVAQRCGVKRLYSEAAFPASIHHRDEPRVLGVANQPHLLDHLRQFNVVLMEDGHISGMNGLILGAAAEKRIEGICLLAEVPYYTVTIPNPKSSKAALSVLCQMLSLDLDLSDLEVIARDTEAEIDELVRSSPEMAELVERMGASQPQGMPESLEEQMRISRRIERLFQEAERDRSKAKELKTELDKLGVFREYEDRFLDLFRKDDQ